VLGLVLLVNALVVGLAVGRVVAWPWVAVPVVLLVAWLVACRLMVTQERSAARRLPVATRGGSTAMTPATIPDASSERSSSDLDDAVAEPGDAQVLQVDEPLEDLEPVGLPAAAPVMRAPGSWDMVPTTLPTYVSMPAATRRTVQTIDLESTGVWSSGRSESDSALAREAEERQASERSVREAAERRATGS
jgi:hypothetical protein